MFIRNHSIILLLFFCCFCSSSTLLAQQKVLINIEDRQNNTTYKGSFSYNMGPGYLVSYKNGIYTFDFNNRTNEKIISLNISDLIWNDRNNNSIVIKKNWLKDPTNNLSSLVPCPAIQPEASSLIDIKVTKNGSSTMKVNYAIKPENKSCNEVKLSDKLTGSFNIRYIIKGFPEAGSTPSTDNTETSTSTTVDPKIPEAEWAIWKNCDPGPMAKVPCMKKYLDNFPNGVFATEALKYCNYLSTRKRYPEIIASIRPGKDAEVIKKCEAFLNDFPKQVEKYNEVQRILRDAKAPTLPTTPVTKTKEEETEVVNNNPPTNIEDKPETVVTPTKPTNTEPNEPTPEVKSPDQIAWEAIADKKSCKLFTEYVNRTPKYADKYRKKALREMAKICDLLIGDQKSKGSTQSFEVSNAFSVVVDSIRPKIDENLYTIRKKTNHPYVYILEFNFPDKRNHIVYFSDPAHPDTNNIRTKSIDFGNLLEPVVTSTQDSIQFKFIKGKEPFIIYFRQKDGGVAYQTTTSNRTFAIKKSFLKNEQAFSGTYIIEVSDEILNAPFTKAPANTNWEITIDQGFWKWYYAIPIGLLGIVALFLVRKNLQTQKSKKKLSEIEAFMGSRKQSLADLHKKEVDEGAWEKELAAKQAQLSSTTAVAETTKARTGIKIKGLRKSSKKVHRYNDEAELNPLLESCVFAFEPAFHWEDTIIERIYFSRKSIKSLDSFLVAQNLKPLLENEGMIPEIGGILMGRPNLSNQDGKYRIIIEEFVPINPEFHNVFKLEFSTQSLVKDLGDIQDRFPAYTAVGWFHTHPGHGLFLSKPDLIIQEQFFGEPYQFAMEIDSLTKQLDTAFFTRMMDGTINNKAQKLENTSWFSWLENVAELDQ